MTETHKERLFWIVATLILLLALALRVLGARGDLAQDEISSLTILSGVDRFDKIFWDINYDNNHPLNSAWLYLVGPNASFLAMRALSIVLGAATVAAAGLWNARHGRAASLIAMLLFATSYLMVNYGSEARGYSGLMLCIILGAMLLEKTLNGENRRIALGLCALAGYLFHFDMCLALVAFGICCFWIALRRSASLSSAFDVSLRTFAWPALFLALALSPLISHQFSVGSIIPFHLKWFLKAYDLSLQSALNLPGLTIIYSDIALAALAALLWFIGRQRDVRAAFYVSAIVILPLTICILQVPNTNYPKHTIPCAIGFLLLTADIMGLAWAHGKSARIATLAVVAIILFGNGQLLGKFFTIGRGHYQQAAAQIDDSGLESFGMTSPQMADMVFFYSRRAGKPLPSFVPQSDWCAKGAPEWFIVTSIMPKTPPEDRIKPGPASCAVDYDRKAVYPAWGLTGVDWTLYKRSASQ